MQSHVGYSRLNEIVFAHVYIYLLVLHYLNHQQVIVWHRHIHVYCPYDTLMCYVELLRVLYLIPGGLCERWYPENILSGDEESKERHFQEMKDNTDNKALVVCSIKVSSHRFSRVNSYLCVQNMQIFIIYYWIHSRDKLYNNWF